MNWEIVSIITEAVGVFAVVVSMLYLALQIRFARLAAADTSRTARAIGVRENVHAMANNSELRENWMKSSNVQSVYETLGTEMNVSANGAIQIDNMCQCWMWLHWGQFKAIKTDADSKDLANIVSKFYATSPMLNCWKESPYGGKVFDAEFVQFVDSAIAKCNAKTVPKDAVDSGA